LTLQVLETLNEAHARWYVARETLARGRGGLKPIHELSGLSRPTILKGIRELQQGTRLKSRRRDASPLPHTTVRADLVRRLREAWEPAHLRKTPSFGYLLPRVRDAFRGTKARDMTTEKVQEFLDRLGDEEGLARR